MSTFLNLYTDVNSWVMSADTTLAKRLVNDAYRDVVARCRTKSVTVAKTLTGAKYSYTFSGDFSISDLLAVEYAYYQATGDTYSYAVAPSALDEVLDLQAASVSGAVQKYALQGLDTIVFWPAPQTTGDKVNLTYTQAPTALSADADIPSDVPSQFHYVIALGAAAQAADAESAFLGDVYGAKYEAGVDKLQAFMNRRLARRPVVARVGYARRPGTQVPHDRSSYFSGDA